MILLLHCDYDFTLGGESLFHSDIDNFDEYVSELKGAGSIHTAHGIMMQELKCDAGEHGGSVMETPAMLRTKQRSIQLGETQNLHDCYKTQRRGHGYKKTSVNSFWK